MSLYIVPIGPNGELGEPKELIGVSSFSLNTPEEKDDGNFLMSSTWEWTVEYKNVDPYVLALIFGLKPKVKKLRKRWESEHKLIRKKRRASYREQQRKEIGISNGKNHQSQV